MVRCCWRGCAAGAVVGGGSLWEGGRELGGRRVPPLSGGRDVHTPVGRSVAGRSCRPPHGDYSRGQCRGPVGHARRGGVGPPPLARLQVLRLVCFRACLYSTGHLLGTGCLDRERLPPRGLAAGVAASRVPVSRAGLSPHPWSGGPIGLLRCTVAQGLAAGRHPALRVGPFAPSSGLYVRGPREPAGACKLPQVIQAQGVTDSTGGTVGHTAPAGVGQVDHGSVLSSVSNMLGVPVT